MHCCNGSRQSERQAHDQRTIDRGYQMREGLSMDVLQQDRTRVRLLPGELHDVGNTRQPTQDRQLVANPLVPARPQRLLANYRLADWKVQPNDPGALALTQQLHPDGCGTHTALSTPVGTCLVA